MSHLSVTSCAHMTIYTSYELYTIKSVTTRTGITTLNSAYNEVAFNKKSAIMKENLHTKDTPFTYNDVTLNKKPAIMKQNLHIFFFVMGGVVHFTLLTYAPEQICLPQCICTSHCTTTAVNNITQHCCIYKTYVKQVSQ